MDAVTIEPLNAIVFLAEPADPGPWPIQRGITLDIPEDYEAWFDMAEVPERVLCTSLDDPSHYKMFRLARDVDREHYRTTGRNAYRPHDRASWERMKPLIDDAIRRQYEPEVEASPRPALVEGGR